MTGSLVNATIDNLGSFPPSLLESDGTLSRLTACPLLVAPTILRTPQAALWKLHDAPEVVFIVFWMLQIAKNCTFPGNFNCYCVCLLLH